MRTTAFRKPGAEGVKVMWNSAVPVAATVLPARRTVTVKSAASGPSTATGGVPVSCRGSMPELRMVKARSTLP